MTRFFQALVFLLFPYKKRNNTETSKRKKTETITWKNWEAREKLRNRKKIYKAKSINSSHCMLCFFYRSLCHFCTYSNTISNWFGSISLSCCNSFFYQEIKNQNILQLFYLHFVKIKCFILINTKFGTYYWFPLVFNIMKYLNSVMQHFVKTWYWGD